MVDDIALLTTEMDVVDPMAAGPERSRALSPQRPSGESAGRHCKIQVRSVRIKDKTKINT